MKVPLLDLKAQYQTIKEEILETVQNVFDAQQFIGGPNLEALEEAIAAYCGVQHAIGVSSGTDALLISLMAAGVKSGDRILTTPYTFFATAGSIARLGAIPVFVDIESETFNLSPENLRRTLDQMPEQERAQLKGIVPVHLYGQCADMEPILQLANEHQLVVIEDAAQAIGSEYRKWRAGAMGNFGCFSFFPSKNLGAFGDGGIVTTRSDVGAKTLRILRNHGSNPKYYHEDIGGNFRLDAFQAAVVLIKLKYLDGWTRRRQENAAKYRQLFENEKLIEHVKLPVEKPGRHIYNQFVIMLRERRDQLRRFLQDSGIGSEIYYPLPLHLQKCFTDLNYAGGDFPVAEHAAKHSLALPIYPELTLDQLTYVVEKIKAFIKIGY